MLHTHAKWMNTRISELLRMPVGDLHKLMNNEVAPAIEKIWARAIVNATETGDFQKFDFLRSEIDAEANR